MRALIAEDDPIVATVLAAALRRMGLQVETARDGAAAWRRISAPDAPSLAIVDWMMPEIDGIELCRRIRRAAGSPQMYVILLTSRDARADVVAGLDAGADDYLVKPFELEELGARVRAGIRILTLQTQLTGQIGVLQESLARVRQLTGLLPICSYCKCIRSGKDYWQQLECYISEHSDAQFTHGVCPGCMEHAHRSLGT